MAEKQLSPVQQNVLVPLASLYPHARNYRHHPPEQIKKLKASLERFGLVRSIVAQECSDGTYVIVAGHGIVEAAQELVNADTSYYERFGKLRTDIIPLEWPPEQVTAYLVADNHLSNDATDDEELLATILKEQSDAGYDLASLGSDDESLRQMLEALGDEYAGGDSNDTEETQGRVTLSDRFIVPPFSVLDARQGYWQDRKKAWLSLGIQSEIGRGEHTLGFSESAEKFGYNRGNSKMGGTPIAESNGRLSDQMANRGSNKNGLLGFSEQARSHYKGKSPAQSNGQDLMRGEYAVGQKEKRLTWVAGDRQREDLDEVSLKNLEAQPQSGTSIFDPVLCELAYSWFCPPDGTILDPFAGGSVRGIVAAKLGRRYVGIDLRLEQIEANEEQVDTILRTYPTLMLNTSDSALDYTPEFTPVEGHGGYLVKRDDLFQIAGVRGGKVRTVWALAQGATGLVTSGSRYSPHVHRVAAIAQRLGIPCRIHIATGENTPDVQGAEDAGAEIIRHKAGYLNVLNARAREDAKELEYILIPFGVVCPEAVKQVSGQVDNLPQDIKRLVIPVGSGITLSGILQGLKRLGRTIPVLGVCVGKDAIEVINEYAPKDWRQTVELVKSSYKFEEHPKEQHLDTLPLDPTYEAKCLPYLQEGDCLWSIGLRASSVESENNETQLPRPQWIIGDSRNIPDLCPEVQPDLIFTCPPYYDLEVYSDDPHDLSAVSSYDEFIQSYRLILKQAIAQLKENRFVCIVVGDIRDKKGFYRNFVGDTISACQDAGAKLYNEAILVTSVGSLPIRVGKQFSSGRKLGKTHQNVLVFCKGDPKKAVQDCGPVVVYMPDEEEIEQVEEAAHV